MTKLSVNINKIALLRNSRGRDFPNVVNFAEKFMQLGVHGITVHPRQDERHITMQDAVDLGQLLAGNEQVEYNIEGYPSAEFLDLVEKIKPTQCTLVPDAPDQLTSDHGWDLTKQGGVIKEVCTRLSEANIRTSLFLDPDVSHVRLVPETGADRIELYTESYAASFGTSDNKLIFDQYNAASIAAQKLGIGVNAGHDLDSSNLAKFLTIKDVLEVSIGHVLTIECIEKGMDRVVKKYLDICKQNA